MAGTDIIEAGGQPPAIRIADRIAEIKTNVQMVQHLMRELMKSDVHYGTVPGTDKPSLYQPGAELICLAFQWSARYLQDDLSYADVVRYRSTCELYSRDSGLFIGSGQGEASSDEEKYRWRRAVNKAEYEAAPEDRRRVKFYKNGGTVQQVRIEPPDIANTVLKMANKRALIAATRTASGCSDMFAQDLEDLPSEVREDMMNEAPPKPQPLGAESWTKLVAQAEGFGYSVDDLKASAAAAGWEGRPEEMPRDTAKRLYRAMRDNSRTPPDNEGDDGPADDESLSGPQEADSGDDEVGEAREGAEAPEDDTEPDVSDEDGEIPGMDAEQFAEHVRGKDDPARKPTNAAKASLAMVLKELPESVWRARLHAEYGVRSRAQLSSAQVAEFTAWARVQRVA